MRLWTLHPRFLDRPGLTGAWREALLAQAVLAGRTRGYRSHPQLERFRAQSRPLESVGAFLTGLAEEAAARGYRFDRARIDQPAGLDPGGGLPEHLRIDATTGQRDHEWRHLRAKLADRSPEVLRRWEAEHVPELHPMFQLCPGPVAAWERL